MRAGALKKRLGRELLDAVLMGDRAHVRELLAGGADVNARDSEHEETPLILAVKFADADMVRLLIERGAEVDARDDGGRTALFFAPVSSDAFMLLLDAGADVNAGDKYGDSILMYKVGGSASPYEVGELLRLGADPSARNDEGETALDLAEGLGLLRVVELLKTAGRGERRER
jgi:ankyrin repeat protein